MPASRPNILLVTTDQQRTDTLSCYGAAHTHTPHLDRLAREGILFRRAYTVNPVCTPTRVSLFTGKMPSRHGAWNVGVNYRGGEMALSHDLLRSGYRTHYVGKAHFETFGGTQDQSLETLYQWEKRYPEFSGPYYGFESIELSLGHATFGVAGHYGAWVRSQVTEAEFRSYSDSQAVVPEYFGGEARDWDLPQHLHSSVWTAGRTIDFLEHHDRAQPFFLAVGFQDPHHPHALPRDFDDRVDPAQVPLPDFTPGELDDKPPHFADARYGNLERSWTRGDYPMAGQGAGANFSSVSEAAAKLGRAYYYGMVRLLDREMGRILLALDRLDLTRDTIVVFTTDHGELLGDHGLWMKGPFHYEQMLRIPLIIRWPGAANPGGETNALYSHVDLAPTLLAAAGVTPSEPLDGVDLAPVLNGESAGVRDHVIVEFVDDPRTIRMKTVITANRKLSWYHGQPFGELYDLDLDPREKVNRWDDPAYAGDKAALLSRIIASLEGLEVRSPRHCYA